MARLLSSSPASESKSINASPNSNSRPPNRTQQVSKEEYDTCRLQTAGQSSARMVALCDQQPGKPRPPPFTVTFRSFTPQPNGLEFKPGQDYYFITALLNQNDPHKRFSPCRELNMKVIFKVCCKPTSGGPSQPAPLSALAPSSTVSPSRRGLGSRRPPVVTLRPSLAKQPNQIGALADYFSTLAPHQLASQQPITVLPIEVTEPQPGEPVQSSSSSDSASSSQFPSNDIQNDSTTGQPVPRPVQSVPEPGPGWPQQQQPVPAGPLPIFDPHAGPEILRSRWAPTPLPPRLTLEQRPAQLEPAPWQLPPVNRPPMLHRPPAAFHASSGSNNNNNIINNHNHHQSGQPQPNRLGASQVGPSSRIGLYPSSVWPATCKCLPRPWQGSQNHLFRTSRCRSVAGSASELNPSGATIRLAHDHHHRDGGREREWRRQLIGSACLLLPLFVGQPNHWPTVRPERRR